MRRYDALVAKHGTYREFEDAVWNALGEISVSEATAACDLYRSDLQKARLADLEDDRRALPYGGGPPTEPPKGDKQASKGNKDRVRLDELRMNFTDQHARDLRRGEWEAEQLARDYDPNYRYWKVSGPPPHISNTPEYQSLCGQAIHERIERLKWAMVESALIHAKQDLRAIAESYDGERRDLLLGMAAEHDARICAADTRKAKHQVELDRLMAEMKQLEGRA